MADADLLTANLRANPIFYADTQLIPYGHYSFLRPGGPPQSDVNINYPLDVSFKRAARDEIRACGPEGHRGPAPGRHPQLDRQPLYGLCRFRRGGPDLEVQRDLRRGYPETARPQRTAIPGGRDPRGRRPRGPCQARDRRAPGPRVPAGEDQGESGPRPDAQPAFERRRELEVRDSIGQLREVPTSREELVSKAVGGRPDLFAIKMGVMRANADVNLAKANAYPDVYLLYQPYTFQNNTYLGVPSAYSWTLGVTATIPLYNRNQGNITRAKINVNQTQLQASSQERQVISDVLDAAQELEQSYISVLEYRREIIPASAKMRDAGAEALRAPARPASWISSTPSSHSTTSSSSIGTRWCVTAGRSWTSIRPSANGSCRDWSSVICHWSLVTSPRDRCGSGCERSLGIRCIPPDSGHSMTNDRE